MHLEGIDDYNMQLFCWSSDLVANNKKKKVSEANDVFYIFFLFLCSI